jgi:hypothetical protein
VPSIPFTAYDIFAYLSSGFVVVGAADFAFRGEWILGAEPSVIEGLVWIVVAYVLGHVISAISAPILERWFAERMLGNREEVLFGERPERFGPIFRGYFSPLPDQIQSIVLARAKNDAQITSVGEALFLYCDAKVRQKPEASPVLANFLNIYSFARNACFALLVGAILLAVGAFTDDTNWETKTWLAAAAIPVAVGLLYRYLKFFRLYAREVFLFYAT